MKNLDYTEIIQKIIDADDYIIEVKIEEYIREYDFQSPKNCINILVEFGSVFICSTVTWINDDNFDYQARIAYHFALKDEIDHSQWVYKIEDIINKVVLFYNLQDYKDEKE